MKTLQSEGLCCLNLMRTKLDGNFRAFGRSCLRQTSFMSFILHQFRPRASFLSFSPSVPRYNITAQRRETDREQPNKPQALNNCASNVNYLCGECNILFFLHNHFHVKTIYSIRVIILLSIKIIYEVGQFNHQCLFVFKHIIRKEHNLATRLQSL